MLARHEVLTVLLIIFGLVVFALALSICVPAAIARGGFEDEDEGEDGDEDGDRTTSFSSPPAP